MRLIDAETLKNKCDEYDWETIDKEPTVEAIPIDYIKDKIDDYGYIALRSTPKIADAYYNSIRELENLMRDYKTLGKQWERERKENESRDTESIK